MVKDQSTSPFYSSIPSSAQSFAFPRALPVLPSVTAGKDGVTSQVSLQSSHFPSSSTGTNDGSAVRNGQSNHFRETPAQHDPYSLLNHYNVQQQSSDENRTRMAVQQQSLHGGLSSTAAPSDRHALGGSYSTNTTSAAPSLSQVTFPLSNMSQPHFPYVQYQSQQQQPQYPSQIVLPSSGKPEQNVRYVPVLCTPNGSGGIVPLTSTNGLQSHSLSDDVMLRKWLSQSAINQLAQYKESGELQPHPELLEALIKQEQQQQQQPPLLKSQEIGKGHPQKNPNPTNNSHDHSSTPSMPPESKGEVYQQWAPSSSSTGNSNVAQTAHSFPVPFSSYHSVYPPAAPYVVVVERHYHHHPAGTTMSSNPISHAPPPPASVPSNQLERTSETIPGQSCSYSETSPPTKGDTSKLPNPEVASRVEQKKHSSHQSKKCSPTTNSDDGEEGAASNAKNVRPPQTPSSELSPVKVKSSMPEIITIDDDDDADETEENHPIVHSESDEPTWTGDVRKESVQNQSPSVSEFSKVSNQFKCSKRKLPMQLREGEDNPQEEELPDSSVARSAGGSCAKMKKKKRPKTESSSTTTDKDESEAKADSEHFMKMLLGKHHANNADAGTTKGRKRTKSKQAPAPKPDVPPIYNVTDADILTGVRRGRSFDHPGNREFHKMAHDYHDFYIKAQSNVEKAAVTNFLVEAVQKKGGRFLRRQDCEQDLTEGVCYVELSPDEARQKTRDILIRLCKGKRR